MRFLRRRRSPPQHPWAAPREDRPREDRPREDRPREDRPPEDRPREDRVGARGAVGPGARGGGGFGARGGDAVRSGAGQLARILVVITSVIAGILVLGILLVLLEANRGNDLVDVVLDVARFFAGPFHDMFELDDRKARIAVNWGIAAAVYLVVGRLIARLLTR